MAAGPGPTQRQLAPGWLWLPWLGPWRLQGPWVQEQPPAMAHCSAPAAPGVHARHLQTRQPPTLGALGEAKCCLRASPHALEAWPRTVRLPFPLVSPAALAAWAGLGTGLALPVEDSFAVIAPRTKQGKPHPVGNIGQRPRFSRETGPGDASLFPFPPSKCPARDEPCRHVGWPWQGPATCWTQNGKLC